MTPGMRIAAAVVGGYVLGRRRKAKLAITMGAWMAGRKLNLNPQKLLTDLTQELSSSPELSELRDRMRDELFAAGKNMATTALTQQAGRLTSSLQERTDRLQSGSSAEGEAADTGEGEERPASRKRSTSARSTATTRRPATATSSRSTTTRAHTSSAGNGRKRSPAKNTAKSTTKSTTKSSTGKGSTGKGSTGERTGATGKGAARSGKNTSRTGTQRRR